MISKKDLLRRSRLYVILDKDIIGDKILMIAEKALSRGVDMVQLRDKTSITNNMIKTAKALKRIAKRYNTPLIINDRLDVAVASDADGLHIGQGDMDLSIVKKIMGHDKIIGLSVENSMQAMKASREGADYIGVGPVFKTPIKENVKPRDFKIFENIKRLNIPFFLIGGIDCKNIHRLAQKGFTKVAVIRAVCRARNPGLAVKRLREAIS